MRILSYPGHKPLIPEPPAIAQPLGVPGQSQPFWSVMIPTYNCADYLKETLRSVLAQDPGPEHMQIEVVDDFSTSDNPGQVVHDLGRGRVGFHRQPGNKGICHNFNTCLQRSRGRWIHLLHGDDTVLPGFYNKMEAAAARHPETALLCCQAVLINGDGQRTGLSEVCPSWNAPSKDVSPNLQSCILRTPAVVVQRRFYEKHGGFRQELPHAMDWEMWNRAILHGGILMLPEALACYREHEKNDTNRAVRNGDNIRDVLRMVPYLEAACPAFDRKAHIHRIRQIAKYQADHFRNIGDSPAADANEKVWLETLPQKKGFRRWVSAYRSLFRG